MLGVRCGWRKFRGPPFEGGREGGWKLRLGIDFLGGGDRRDGFGQLQCFLYGWDTRLAFCWRGYTDETVNCRLISG